MLLSNDAETLSEKTAFAWDKWLLLVTVALLALGLVMVASASMPIAQDRFSQPFHYLIRQSIAVGIGLCCATVVFLVPVRLWLKVSLWFLLGAAVLLVLVLIPGIGREINNSMRWINLGFFTLQASELAKLAVIVYFAGFLKRRGNDVRSNLRDAIGPVVLLAVLTVLLLLEPDYGSVVVIMSTVLGMMFLARINIWHFIALLSVAGVAMIAVLSMAEYRWLRLVCFLDPWSDPYGCGYQLTQALIAIGSGGVFGVGLGASVQKLHYLPEAYNDFLFAVLAEELGLFGVLCVVGLYAVLIWRIFQVSAHAERLSRPFSAYLAYGIGLLFAVQALINMGVNLGLLPPKGLTLPLMSYGGSSMVVMCIAITIVLRIEWENRRDDPRFQRRLIASVQSPAWQK